MTTAQAVTAALAHRERTGEGQHVRVSMLDAVVSFLWASDMGGQTFVGKEVSVQRAATFIDLIYETKTGYISVSAMSNKQWRALCVAVDHPEWLEDERFKTPALRDKNANERLELTQQTLLTRPAEDWLDVLDTAGVPCSPVLKRSEMINHPVVTASNLIFESDHPVAGRIRQTRPAARFSESSPELLRGAPLHGEHNNELLMELGISEAEVASLKKEGIIS
jgi:crotonobetainyl-CoA:carnitine CoA-transferase CaiB-like acyl-CoA transferase